MHKQLNSSTAQPEALLLSGMGLVLLVCLGCQGVVAIDASDSPALIRSKRVVREAGVVLAGRSGYLCLTLEEVGLRSINEVVSIDSSCDCVAPRMVKYQASESASARGILVEFIDEPVGKALHGSTAPAHLGVIVTATLADGREHDFVVNLLHTHLIEEDRQ